MERVVWCMKGMGHIARIAARALEAPLIEGAPIGDCHVAHVVGMFDPPSFGVTLENTERAARLVVHWCGPDVQLLAPSSDVPGDVHVCDSVGLSEELRDAGVDARVVSFPTMQHVEPVPLPAAPVVSVFYGSNPDLYEAGTVLAVQQSMPDVRFMTYGQGTYDEDGMRRLIQGTSVHLRLTQHDGSAVSAREYLEAGRRVVTSQQVPHARVVPHDDLDAIVTALREELARPEPDAEAAAFWRERNSDARFLAELDAVLGPAGLGL